MVKDDIEIEDARKHDLELGSITEELDSKALDAKNEIVGKFPFAVTDAWDPIKSEDEGQCLNGLKMKARDNIAVKNEMEDQTSPRRETSESMIVEGYTVSKSEGRSINEANIEEQTVNEQSDAKNEVVGQNVSNGGAKKDKSAVMGRNPAQSVIAEKNVMVENPGVELSVEKDSNSGRTNQNADAECDSRNTQIPTVIPSNAAPPSPNAAMDNVLPGGDEEMEDAVNNDNEEKELNDGLKQLDKEILPASPVAKTIETAIKQESDHSSLPCQLEAATPSSLVRNLPAKAGDHSGETVKTLFTPAALPMMAEGDDGTPEDQAAFMKEVESFYRERAMDFKPPKFYGQPLNCLKLWRAVIRLGGYDRVTGSKLWRQVGESFHPPKTCTTVSWTFRIFYEKSLLEYERHKTQSGELQLPVSAFLEASGADTEGNSYQGSGPGRARRDAAARAMQGWHAQRLFGNGEDKNNSNMAKREKNVRTIGSLKQKRPNEVEHSVKAARVETSKQLATTVVDVGPPADWVKINVRQTKDCFEVYALVPGLLREEVRVQSDPAGRLVITGQPEQLDNPWGITPFKKVISLPSRIDPLQTSAVVSLHGRLFVRVPFEQPNV